MICDDHPIVGEALRVHLSRELAAEVRHYTSFAAAHLVAAAMPALDLWILDINLPGEDVARNVAAARALRPDTPVVLFSGTEDAAQIRLAAASGAQAFLPKSMPPDMIVTLLRRVLAGERYFPNPAVASGAITAPPGSDVRLTDRQRAVLSCLAQGQANKEIGRTLAISPATVKVHLAQIFGVLGVANRTEAVIAAGRLGLIP